MKIRLTGAVLIVLMATVGGLDACGTAGTPRSPPAVHWTYSGEEGPAHWGSLSPTFAACSSGRAQSPIDIASPAPRDLRDPVFHYQPSRLNIVNNGHTIQVDYDPGSYLDLDGSRYELVQFHFHAPSEHAVSGRLAAAELHLVHRNAAGQLAVVGVLIDAGAENVAFKTVWDNLPAVAGPERHLDAEVNAAAMLPDARTSFRYDGSLTTPPCSEGVKWNVMARPIEMSAAQLAAFTRVVHQNNRPLQPLNGRALIEDTSP